MTSMYTGMLMTPFVLHAKPIPHDPLEKEDGLIEECVMDSNVARYCDILSSIEELIN
ncbi:9979_t:CDS:2, partial [Diversispora eburnea]